MTKCSRLEVTNVIDQSPLGFFHIKVLALCFLCMTLGGFGVQSLAYVAPVLVQEWQISNASLGPVFGLSLFGMLVGSLGLSMVADQTGRRPVLIVAMLALSLCMFLTVHVAAINELLGVRFFAGICLGAIVPNAIALSGEYSPLKLRVTIIMLVSSGFIVGGALGGIIAAALIPVLGWQSIFYMGGGAALVVTAVMIFILPDSLQWLVLHGKRLQQVRRWLWCLDARLKIDESTELVVEKSHPCGKPLSALFSGEMAMGTVLLWIMNFMNLLCVYFLATWIPILMSGAGYSTSEATFIGSAMWIGGGVGNWLLGWVVDRRGFGPVLIPSYIISVLAIACITLFYDSWPLAIVSVAVAGFGVLGGQSALNALAAVYYPLEMRSTGVGWSLGLGRLGAIIGPVLGGELMRLNWSTANVFTTAMVPAIIVAIAIFLFWHCSRDVRVAV